MTILEKVVAVGAFAGLCSLSFLAPQTSDHYKSHLLMSGTSSTDYAPSGGLDQADQSPVNPLVEEEPQNHSVSRPHWFIDSDTSTWLYPNHPLEGEPSNAPGSPNTSPEDRDRAFETYGRGIPLSKS